MLDALLHEDPRAIGTDLTGRIEIAQDRARDRVFQIGIVKDEDWGFAAKLHRDVFHALSR